MKINAGEGNDYISNQAMNVTINAGAGNDTISNWSSATHLKINAGAGDDHIENTNGDNSTINGGSGNDVIYSGGKNLTVSGGTGNDDISIGGNSTISGGKDNDLIVSVGDYDKYSLFEYAAGDGNDTIQGFGATDTLTITGGKYSAAKKGKDIIVTVSKGKITLEGAASLSGININDNLILTDSTKSPVTVGSAIKTIDASLRTKAIKITDNALDNSITGGKGNDSLWGDAGDNTFIYQAGNGSDTIFDYASGDMLKILKSDGSAGGKFTKSKYSGGTLSLTISGGGNVIFDDVSRGDTFNINNTAYKISGSKLKKQ